MTTETDINLLGASKDKAKLELIRLMELMSHKGQNWPNINSPLASQDRINSQVDRVCDCLDALKSTVKTMKIK